MSASNNSGIFRTIKNGNYSIVSNTALRDRRLSFGARGLWAYLMTKTDDWQIREADLIAQSPLGRDGVRKLLRELESCGYLIRRRFQNESGKIEWEHLLYEEPQNIEKPGTGKPSPEIPSVEPWTAFPSPEKPSPEKPSIYELPKQEGLNEIKTEKAAGVTAAAAGSSTERDELLISAICAVCGQEPHTLRGRQIEGLRTSLAFVKRLDEFPDVAARAHEIRRRFNGTVWTLAGPPQPSQIETEWNRQGMKADRLSQMEISHANNRLSPRQQAAEDRLRLQQRLLRNGGGPV